MIYCCSVCFGVTHPRTMIEGTIICTKCLEKAKKAQQENIIKAVNDLVKEGDIYD